MVWFLTLGTKPIFIRICMRSSEQNRGNISSLIGGKMLNFGMEAFFILVFLNIKIRLVISQINFLWRHHFGTRLGAARTCGLVNRKRKGTVSILMFVCSVMEMWLWWIITKVSTKFDIDFSSHYLLSGHCILQQDCRTRRKFLSCFCHMMQMWMPLMMIFVLHCSMLLRETTCTPPACLFSTVSA